MALVGLLVLIVATIAFAVAQAELDRRREENWAQERRQREQAMQGYRAYLNETAKQIRTIPVDPRVVAQAETRYFEEQRKAKLYLWAIDRDGRFLFGVPNEEFARLNSAYDSYHQAIQSEGHFTDRQDFIRRLAGSHAELNLPGKVGVAGVPLGVPWLGAGWEYMYSEHYVFSAPMEDKSGQVLGTLYLKVTDLGFESRYRSGGIDAVADVSGGVLGIALLFVWFMVPTWVYLDARSRGMKSPVWWSAVVLVSFVFGLCVYLILRPERSAGVCPKCGRTTNGGTYCPFCGSPVRSEFCGKCGYPTQPDWVYCPNCQVELRPPAAPVERPAPEPAKE